MFEQDLEIVDPVAHELQEGGQHVVELLQDAVLGHRLDLGALAEDAGDPLADLHQPAVDLHVVRHLAAADPARERRLQQQRLDLLHHRRPPGRGLTLLGLLLLVQDLLVIALVG